MKADSIKFFDFLDNGKTILEIPVFQRNYEWGEQQCKQLFKDLTLSAKENHDHFIGTIVYVSQTGEKMSHIYQIIDGQQRITSLMLLLKALADLNNENKAEIIDRYLKNKYLNENDHLKLKPIDYDIEAFKAVMNNKIDEVKEPSKVIENYKLFKKEIQKSKLSSNELYTAINYFNIVYIQLESEAHDENPQVIFESLNSTGVSLSSSDLVRNFLLMSLKTQDQNKLYKEYWMKIESYFSTKIFEEFLRHYLIMKTHKLINKNKVYDSYKEFYYNNKLTPENALSDLYKFAGYYDDMLHANTESQEMNQVLKYINIMDSKVVYPYFMMLIDMVKTNEITWQDVLDLVHIMESYLFRLKVCKKATNGLNRIIIALCDKKKTNYKLRELNLLSTTFPTNFQVKNSLLNVDLYKQRNNLAKLVLIALEENRTRETINFENAQVEHIMPQRLNNDWRLDVEDADKVNENYGGTIGNLTLTMYNQEISNKRFSVKKDFYIDSNISLTREIANKYNIWNKKSIITRINELTNELIKIFPMPNIKKEISKDLSGEYALTDTPNITGKKPIRLTIEGHDYSVDSWKKILIIVLNYVWSNDSLNYEKVKKDKIINNRIFKLSPNSPKQLSNGSIIETSFSAMNILALVTKIAQICDIADDISYSIR